MSAYIITEDESGECWFQKRPDGTGDSVVEKRICGKDMNEMIMRFPDFKHESTGE
jgi:hypothetical protein